MKAKLINEVTLAGKLYSHTLEKKVSQKGVNYIGGTIDLQTDDDGLNIVTVTYVYVAPTYPAKGDKPERPNPNYAILEKIINSGKTVLTDGEDAWMLKLTPSLAVNDFPNRDGEMVAAKRLEGGFVSIINKLPEKDSDRNEFRVDAILSSAVLVEADEEKGITEDYLELTGYFFNYAKAIFPAKFIVKSKGGINYFEGLDISKSNPVFTKVWGSIQSQTIVTRREEESAFGEASVKEFTSTRREWVVTGAATEPYVIGDAEIGITADEIKDALSAREIRLAEIKKQNEEYQASKAAGGATSTQAAAVTAAQGAFNF